MRCVSSEPPYTAGRLLIERNAINEPAAVCKTAGVAVVRELTDLCYHFRK